MHRKIALVLASLALSASLFSGGNPAAQSADAKPAMAVSGGGGREPLAPTQGLHPDVPASDLIQYWKPAERVDLAAQAALAPDSANQSDAKGAVLKAEKVGPLAVVEHGPSGAISEALARPQVYLVFSQPMVPVAKLGSPLLSVPGVGLTPPLPGVYRWISTKSLAFEPGESVAPLQEYRVKVDGRVASLYGKRLAEPFEFVFHSGSLRFLSLRSASAPDRDLRELSSVERKRLLLAFNQPVLAADISRSLELRIGDTVYRTSLENWNPAADEAVRGLSPVVRCTLLDDLPEDSEVEIRLSARAAAYAGAFPTETDSSLRFRTLKPFRLLRLPTETLRGLYRYRADDANAIWIDFSHDVDPASLGAAFSVENTSGSGSGMVDEIKAEKRAARNPSYALTPRQVPIPPAAVEVFGSRVRINGLKLELTPEYLVKILPVVRDVNGRVLEAGGSFKFRLGNPLSYAYFPHQGWGMMEAQFPPKTLAEVQDLEYLKYDVRKIGSLGEVDRKREVKLKDIDLSSLPPQTKHFEMLDLLPWLNRDGKGWVEVRWAALDRSRDPRPRQPYLFLQVTDLAATTRVGYNEAICLVSSISTGKPVAGAKVTLLDRYAERREAATDAAGLAVFRFGPGEYESLFYTQKPGETYRRDEFGVLVEKGPDKMYYRPTGHDTWRYDVASRTSPVSATVPKQRAFLFSDRRIYRPGEEMRFRGIARRLEAGTYSALASASYTVSLIPEGGSDAADSVSGTTTAAGGFWGELLLAEDLSPGSYRLVFKSGKLEAVDWIIVSNFRRLQFQASFDLPTLPVYAGGDVSAALSAEYLAGGAMRDASFSGYWSKEPYSFRPADPKWNEYRFQQGDEWGERQSLSSFDGRLDGEGRASVRQTAAPEGVKGKTYRYRVRADVVDDLTGQSVTAQGGVVVYPASFLIGAYAREASGVGASGYFAKGTRISLECALVSPDGNAYAGVPADVSVSVAREEWKIVQQQGVRGIDSRWERTEIPVLKTAVKTEASRASLPLVLDAEGQYVVEMAAVDSAGRESVNRFRLWVYGKQWVNWYGSNSSGLELATERVSYAPGETARILLKSPIPAGAYLVTTEREGIMSHRILNLEGPTQVIEVPVEERHVPIFYVAVSSYSVRRGQPGHAYGDPDLDKPAGYFGLTQVRVDPASRRLKLEISSDKPSYLPGTKATFTVRATVDGKPVKNAEVCFMAVDRGVVDLVDYHVPDPMTYFYNPEFFPLGTYGGDSRDELLDPVTYEVKDQFGGDAGDSKVSERKDFRPTAVFEPALVTGADGYAKASFTWPDNLTTYRCTAVAMTAERFGLAEKDSRVANPINVKTALPRKLRLRDTAYAGVIVTNLSPKAETVSIRCESDLLAVDGITERSVTVPTGGTMEVPFALCAVKAGSGTISFRVKSSSFNEILRESFLVEEPFVFESVASIGSVEGPAGEKASFLEGLMLPGATPGGKGKLEVTLGSSKLPMLSGAVRYVFTYPYGCNEQLSSRVLPLVLFGDYIDAFGLRSEVGDPRKAAEASLAAIADTQRPDGSFGIWKWSEEPNFYVTVRVAHIVDLMEKKGWTVPASLKRGALFAYIKERRASQAPFDLSYAMRVLASAGELRRDEADAALRSPKGFNAAEWSQMGLVYAALGDGEKADFCLQKAMNFVKQSPRSVDVDASGLGFFNDRVSTLAMLLDLMVLRNPSSDIARRVVQTIVSEQKAGYWVSTNATFWVLAAFADVVKADGGKPDFAAEVTVAGKRLMAGDFRELSGKRVAWAGELSAEPLASFAKDTLLPFEFSKTGKGTLYYGAELRYTVPLETATNRDEGFEVVSRITAADGSDLNGAPLKRGGLYKLSVSVTSDKARNFVAVRMPVPSGADIVESYDAPRGRGRYYGDDDFVEPNRIKVFDNEAHAYVSTFAPGSATYSILFRATAAGVYPVPPATAECMYESEVFGRDVAGLVTIAK
jgi:uncharacterized protein YfaS (alpha-2-macroglobulin family)